MDYGESERTLGALGESNGDLTKKKKSYQNKNTDMKQQYFIK